MLLSIGHDNQGRVTKLVFQQEGDVADVKAMDGLLYMPIMTVDGRKMHVVGGNTGGLHGSIIYGLLNRS